MYLVDGFRTLITFALTPAVFFREKDVSPPSLEGGGGIETTTMRNVSLRTYAAHSLVTVGEMNGQAQYDPFIYSGMLPTGASTVLGVTGGVINVTQNITITFPDAATITFGGWLDHFKPGTLKEGEFPLAEFKIIPGNITPGVPGLLGAPGILAARESLPTFTPGFFLTTLGR